MISFIAFIFCLMVAIYDFYKKYIGLGLLQVGLAILNLPFAIQWIASLF